MDAIPSTSEFKHEPLPDSTTHIRLLEIQEVTADEQVVCVLTTWSVEEAPDYYALSYVLRIRTRCVLCTDRPSWYQIYLGLSNPKSSNTY
jgi:hypothetical protein